MAAAAERLAAAPCGLAAVSVNEVQPDRSSRPQTAAVRAERRCMINSVGGGPVGSPVEHLSEVVAHRDLELVVGAAARLAIGAPAQELAGVPQPAALQLVVLDLHDQ